MAEYPQRVCPHCGTPVAQRAEDCLGCGAHLRDAKKWPAIRLPRGSLWLPMLLVVVAVLLWLWKPWQSLRPAVAGSASAEPSVTAQPSPGYEIAPTATPLQTALPSPTPTLPPSQTVHTVKKGETLITIAKLYGTTAAAIRTANNLKTTSPIHEGDKLTIPLLMADTPTPSPTQPPTPTPQVYVVTSGDTLSEIAKRFGTTVEAILQASGLADATGIKAGTRLLIPASLPTAVPVVVYEVKSGDTLSGIAAKYKVTVQQIKDANGLKGDALKIGQKLVVKGAVPTPAPTATETPAPTPTPTLTPVATPVYAAPSLLSPADGTTFSGSDTVILLSWLSEGFLEEDEYYVLRLRRAGPVAQLLPPVWTKVTSYRLDRALYLAGSVQEFFWQVSVMRKTGETEEGAWTGVEISPRGAQRTFRWQ